MHPNATTTLSVVTSHLEDGAWAEALIMRADAHDPLVWLHGGDGLIGLGEAVRWEFSGADRFTSAAAQWRELAAQAQVDDMVGMPGTGLVAFAAFAFSSTSARSSTLVVPRLILGRNGDTAWVTHISVAGEAPWHLAPSPARIAAGRPARFTEGTLSEAGYRVAVAEGIESITSDAVEKVVLARDLVTALPRGFDLRAPLARLAGSYPDCWTFAVDGLIGSSPEMLVRVDSGTVTARVLAGSTARGTSAASDTTAALGLVTSEKDRDEHGFAVRSVLASLSSHTSSLVSSEIPFALKLPNLWHLASDVEGRLADGSSSLDMLAALHPTAAVAGTPTDEALKIIDRLEPFDRGRYAGPVGWVDADGDGEWAIALRSAQLDPDGTLTAYAGAGIVAGSVPAHELAETGMKFRPIIDAFS